MDEFPDNSQRVIRDSPAQKAETKEVKQVTSGEVIRRKKPVGKRFAEFFGGGDARGVWGYVMVDVVVPAIKDMVADGFSQGIERMLFGDSRSSGRRSSGRYGGVYSSPQGHFSYNRPTTIRQDPRNEPRSISRRGRSTQDFDEIILANRAEAEEVIDRLFDLVSRFDQATVADLYDLVGITGNYQDEKWGWTDIRGAGAQRVRGGYLLNLPRPEPLT